MTPFLGNYQNKLDAKGRVSIPATFRAALKAQSTNGGTGVGAPLILRPSHQYDCVEAWPERAFEVMSQQLVTYDQFSVEHDDFATTIYGDAFPVETDKEGRIVIPAELASHASLTESVFFLGLGTYFQIWEPVAAERRRAEARESARSKRLTLPAAAHRAMQEGSA